MDESEMLRLSDRWWDDIWRDGNIDVADDILADPFVRHTGTGSAVTSLREYKSMLADFQRTLCRPQTTIDDRVIDGDRVWTRATSRGLNRESGDSTVVTWMMVQRMENGRIAEHWLLTMRGVNWSA